MPTRSPALSRVRSRVPSRAQSLALPCVPSRPLTLALAATLLALVATLLVPVPRASAAGGRELSLDFEGGLRRQEGTAALRVRTVTAHGGSVGSTPGYSGGSAADLPAFVDSSTPPMAIFTVVDEQGADDLEPQGHDFRFGADFALDAKSQTSAVDNGNNLVQRGLFNAPMQFKLELDGGHPKCRVKGSQGAVLVKGAVRVEPDTWYRVSCRRAGNEVRLTVVRRSDGTTWRYQGSGAIGSLSTKPSTPLSVGGKAASATRILTRASDQFNGLVDNAFVNVLD